MLNIDENKLKLLLEKRRKHIEKPKYKGLGEIISSISLIITLLLSDFSNLKILPPRYFKIVAWIISILVFVYGIYTFINSILKSYSINQLYNEIANIDPMINHPFDIVIIRNNIKTGEYLLFKSKRWKCWLFPNYHCKDGDFDKAKELRYVRECLKRDLNIQNGFDLRYIGNKTSEKYSVGDSINKEYNFYFFQVDNINFCNERLFFRKNGKKYCWKTMDQMYSNKNMVKKNQDVLDFVRQMCDIS